MTIALKNFVQIAFNLPTDRVFTYSLPDELITLAKIGQRITAPFGKRQLIGYLVGFEENPESGYEIKPIKNILDDEPLIDGHLLELSKWISEYYCAPLGMVLEGCLPPGLKGKNILSPRHQKFYSLAIGRDEASLVLPELKKRAPRQAEIICDLMDNEHLSSSDLDNYSAVSALIYKGFVREFLKEIKPTSYYGKETVKDKLLLNPCQREVLDFVAAKLNNREYANILMHGITGSGKTEVYLQAIEHASSLGKQALVLVPEISLTPQLIERFQSRFSSQVAVLHSSLRTRERMEEWHRLQSGQAAIGIGVRAAVLTPLPNLGLIVIDEEHENSYKQDNMPRYHARDVAIVRAKMLNIPIILGSATPSLESYYNTQIGKAHLVTLPDRIGQSRLPAVKIVDLRDLQTADGPPLFSAELISGIEKRLERGEQSLLFLNRRGHFSCAICKECGQSVKCPHCSVSLTYHSHGNKLCCHYCDYTLPPIGECPQCKGAILSYSGLGTQRVEKELQLIFPKARILRMDKDSVRHKEAHWEFFEALREGEIDIVLGTQMITKGLDLPNITLVGVIAADLIMNFPDFRAAERTFQLLTQVAGRAGRGDKPGEVIIQSFLPEHYALETASSHDFESFYQREMEYRKALRYPPYYRLANLLVRGKDPNLTLITAQNLSNYLKGLRIPKLIVLGAIQAPINKLRNEFRWQILLKGPSASVTGYGLKRAFEYWQKEKITPKIRLDIDADALSLL